MYAIIKHGGHQYRVSTGDRLLVDRIPAEVGSKVRLESVLLLADGDRADTGGVALSGASVTATVVAHRRGQKLRVFTYKPKKRRRRTLGYRSQLTELLIEDLTRAGAKPQRTSTRAAKVRAEPRAPVATGEAAQAEAAPPHEAAPPKAAPRKRVQAGGDAATAENTPAAKAAKPAGAAAARRRTRSKEPGDGA